jgi:hypothetical protein
MFFFLDKKEPKNQGFILFAACVAGLPENQAARYSQALPASGFLSLKPSAHLQHATHNPAKSMRPVDSEACIFSPDGRVAELKEH